MSCGWTRRRRRVIVGPKAALSTRIVPVREINWLGDAPFDSRAGMASGRQGPLHPPAARGDHPPDRRRPTAEVELLAPEDGVSAGPGLRLLCARRQPRLWRRLDLEGNVVKHLLLALALALPLPALAETREERVAVAAEYVDLALQSFDMDAIIKSLSQPILQQVAAAGQRLTDDQMAQIDKLYVDTFTEPMTALMREQAELMADIMTLAEITALRDFYATPEGRSVMAKLPQLTAAQQPGACAC